MEKIVEARVIDHDVYDMLKHKKKLYEKQRIIQEEMKEEYELLEKSDIYKIERKSLIKDVYINGEDIDLTVTLRTRDNVLYQSVVKGKKRVKFEIPFLKFLDTSFVENMFIYFKSNEKCTLDISYNMKHRFYEKGDNYMRYSNNDNISRTLFVNGPDGKISLFCTSKF